MSYSQILPVSITLCELLLLVCSWLNSRQAFVEVGGIHYPLHWYHCYYL